MSSLILGSVKEKLIIQTSKANDSHFLARASVCMSMRGAAVLLTPEYHRAVTRWTVHVALRGAARLMGLKRGSDSGGRRISIPTPIVFLESERSGWGDMLK